MLDESRTFQIQSSVEYTNIDTDAFGGVCCFGSVDFDYTAVDTRILAAINGVAAGFVLEDKHVRPGDA
jgi:hypothetical protein